MNIAAWLATTNKADLSPEARALTLAIARRFISSNSHYCNFHDPIMAMTVALPLSDVKRAKAELVERGFLRNLETFGGVISGSYFQLIGHRETEVA